VIFGRTHCNPGPAAIAIFLRHHRAEVFGWLLVVAIHAVAVIAFAAHHTLLPDEDAYINLAQNLAQYGSYHLDNPAFSHAAGEPYTHSAPGWPFLMSIGYAVDGLTGCWVIMWLVWCLNSVLADRLALTLGLAKKWRWALVGWVTFNPLFLFYHGHLMTEAAVIGLNLALTVIGIRLIESPAIGRVIFFAVVSAAGHMTRTQTLLPVIAIWLVAAATTRVRRVLPLFLLFAVVHVGLLSPWLWRMNHVGASPFATELKLGVSIYARSGMPDVLPRSDEADEALRSTLERMTPRERENLLVQEGLNQILLHPAKYIKRCIKRSFRLVAATPSFYEVSRVQYLMILVSSVVFYHAFLIAAAVGLVRCRPWSEGAWLMVVAVGVWYAFHIVINVSIRNRLPSDIWVAALAIATWSSVAVKSARVVSEARSTSIFANRENRERCPAPSPS
jgi:hypothetical protein